MDTVITISRKESAHTNTHAIFCWNFRMCVMELKATNVSYIQICSSNSSNGSRTMENHIHDLFPFYVSLHVFFFWFWLFVESIHCRFSNFSFRFWMLRFGLVKQRKRAHKLKFRVQQIYCCEFLHCLIVRWCNDYESSNTASSLPVPHLFFVLFFPHIREPHQRGCSRYMPLFKHCRLHAPQLKLFHFLCVFNFRYFWTCWRPPYGCKMPTRWCRVHFDKIHFSQRMF